MSDLRDFRDGLEAISQTLKGTATFDSFDGELTLAGSINKEGQIFWEVTLRCIDSENDNVLNFRVEGDQSYLPALITDVDALLKEARTEAAAHE